ncbi:MAG: hypothetical protein PHS02_04015, partial [Candidatus ainarchaeum sp.]|nr:hypothetical protein [Candidatus ainarchaeum sp.]
FILASLMHAIPMLEPVKQEISNGEEIYLGEIGPGQTISMSFDGRPKVGGMYGVGGTYEIANATGLPEGWTATPSDWAGIPLQVKVTADKYAPEGEYRFNVVILDLAAEGLQNYTLSVKVNITHDVLRASLDSSTKETLSGQPARFYVTIDNKASTGDVFKVSSINIPKWAFNKYVYVPAKGSRTIYYEVVSAEESEYYPVISVVSESSPMINQTLNATVNVNPSLLADFKATNNGMLFFPSMNGLIYSLAGLLSNLF